MCSPLRSHRNPPDSTALASQIPPDSTAPTSQIPPGPTVLGQGGETNFPDLGISVPPKRGRAVLWASTFDSAPLSKDKRTRHESLPVVRGMKYAANIWFYHRDLQAAIQRGCFG